VTDVYIDPEDVRSAVRAGTIDVLGNMDLHAIIRRAVYDAVADYLALHGLERTP
jgi:hypothetical protein